MSDIKEHEFKLRNANLDGELYVDVLDLLSMIDGSKEFMTLPLLRQMLVDGLQSFQGGAMRRDFVYEAPDDTA